MIKSCFDRLFAGSLPCTGRIHERRNTVRSLRYASDRLQRLMRYRCLFCLIVAGPYKIGTVAPFSQSAGKVPCFKIHETELT